MTLDWLIFGVSAVVAVFGATMVIVQRNPVASVLYLILSLIAQAVCYIQLGAFFLGMLLIIVYAGAIMVLFLFVIMLLNLRGSEDLGKPGPVMGRASRYLFAILLTVELVLVFKAPIVNVNAVGMIGLPPEGFGTVSKVATLLLTQYLYPFELVGVMLLVAVVGAVVIAKTERSQSEAKSPEVNVNEVTNK